MQRGKPRLLEAEIEREIYYKNIEKIIKSKEGDCAEDLSGMDEEEDWTPELMNDDEIH